MLFKKTLIATALIASLAYPALADDQGPQIDNPITDAIAALTAGEDVNELPHYFGLHFQTLLDAELAVREVKDRWKEVDTHIEQVSAERAGPLAALETWEEAKAAISQIFETYVTVDMDTTAILAEMTNIDVKIAELKLVVDPLSATITAQEAEMEAIAEEARAATVTANARLAEFIAFANAPVIEALTSIAASYEEQELRMAELERNLAEICRSTGNYGHPDACENVSQAVAVTPPIPRLAARD